MRESLIDKNEGKAWEDRGGILFVVYWKTNVYFYQTLKKLLRTFLGDKTQAMRVIFCL